MYVTREHFVQNQEKFTSYIHLYSAAWLMLTLTTARDGPFNYCHTSNESCHGPSIDVLDTTISVQLLGTVNGASVASPSS